MALPAIASAMRASPYPNVANAGATFYELMLAVVAAVIHATALDTELKAVEDEAGEDVFPEGVSHSEAEFTEIFERRPQFMEQFGAIVERYGAAGASEGGGVGEIRLRFTAAQVRALGGVGTAQLALGNVPAKARITRAYALNLNQALTGLVTCTASIGTVAGSYVNVLAAVTVFAANAANEGAIVTPVLSYTAISAILLELAAGADLDQLDVGILDATEVLEVVVEYTR